MQRKAYIFPGIYGPDNHMIEFCDLSKDDLGINFELINYPDISECSYLLRKFDYMTSFLADVIQRMQPGGELVIGGYSFGACVALEVARTLKNNGRSIRYLIMIDPPVPGMSFDYFYKSQNETTVPRSAWKHIGMWFLEKLGWFRSIRLSVTYLTKFMGTRFSRRLERLLVRALRERARRKEWHPAPLNVSGAVIVSNEFKARTEQKWMFLCPLARIHVLTAGHIVLIRGCSGGLIRSILAADDDFHGARL